MTRSSLILVIIALLIGAYATFYGLSQMHWPTVSSLSWNALYHFLGPLAVGIIVVEVISMWLRVGRLTAGAITISLISILTGIIWPLFISIFFALASFVLGQAVLSVLKINKDRVSILTALLIGAGVYGTGVGLLAHFPVNYPGVYGIALLLPVILGWHSVANAAQMLKQFRFQPAEFRYLDLAITLIALVHFSAALMPEVGHDALAMHLFIPGHLSHHHEWGFDVNTYVWAAMPMMVDWIYSFVYILAGETAARLINVGSIFALSWLLRDLVIWAGGNAQGARWAVLIFLVTPLTFLETSSLFIESIWASFIVAGALSIFKALSSDNAPTEHLPVAAFLLGCALASKAVTLTILPVLFLLLIVRYRAWLKVGVLSAILLGLALFLVIGIIPYITAWAITGNPVFPFFNGYFQAPQYPAVNFSGSPYFEKGVSWNTIYRITFDSGRYLEGKPGAAGFQWLLLLLPSIALFITTWNRRGLVLIIVGVLSVALTFQQTAYLRYIFPAYVILCAAIGFALSVIFTNGSVISHRFVVIISTITVFFNILFFKTGTHYGNIALKPLLSEAGRYRYLQHRLPVRNAVDLVNQLNINKTPVAVFAPPLMAGLHSDALYPSWYNHKFQSLIQSADTANTIADVLFSKGVDYIILDEHWGKLEKRLIINKVTKEILDLGSISVRVLREEYQFNTELLNDTGFSEGGSWQLSEGAKVVINGVIIRRKSAAIQVVPVTPGGHYLFTVKASCLSKPAKGRLQINWLDIESRFLTTDIRVFDCTQLASSHSMAVVAPNDGFNAVIYATGHTDEPLVIHEVSFRK